LKKILPLFSYLFHPIFIPVQATLLYFFYKIPDFQTKEQTGTLLIQIILFTILIPILFFLALKLTGNVDSIMVVNISQRKLPLVVQCFLILFLLRNYIRLENHLALHFFFLAALLSTLITLILLFAKIKSSLHMMSISALAVFIIGLTLQYDTQNKLAITLSFLISGLVASSRLVMKAHTLKELFIGTLVGCLPQLLLLRFWL
jgi:hypothetical protein